MFQFFYLLKTNKHSSDTYLENDLWNILTAKRNLQKSLLLPNHPLTASIVGFGSTRIGRHLYGINELFLEILLKTAGKIGTFITVTIMKIGASLTALTRPTGF